MTEDYTSEGFGEDEADLVGGINPSEEEGPDIPIVDGDETNSDVEEDSFEEISTGRRENITKKTFFFLWEWQIVKRRNGGREVNEETLGVS